MQNGGGIYCLNYVGGVAVPGPFAIIFPAPGNEDARKIAGKKCACLGQRIGKVQVLSFQCGVLTPRGSVEKVNRVLTREEAREIFRPKRAIKFDPQHYQN